MFKAFCRVLPCICTRVFESPLDYSFKLSKRFVKLQSITDELLEPV